MCVTSLFLLLYVGLEGVSGLLSFCDFNEARSHSFDRGELGKMDGPISRELTSTCCKSSLNTGLSAFLHEEVSYQDGSDPF